MRKGIYKDEHRGTWYIQTKVKVNDSFRNCTIRGYSSKSEADRDYERAVAEWVKEHTKHCEVIFFRDLLEEVEQDRSTSVKIQTLRGDASVNSKYLLPKFGNKLIADVFKKETIQDWYSDFIQLEGITVHRKNKVITRFKDILAYAYSHMYCDAPTYQICDIVLKHLRVNVVQQKEKDVWTREEFEKFIDAIPQDKIWYPLFILFGELGCRIGELQGLQWQHLDFDRGQIFICQQVVESTGEGHWVIETPKTASSIRYNRLTPDTLSLLSELKNIMHAREEDFIFGGKNPVCRHAIRRAMYKYASIAGVHKITPHGIRHSNASWLIQTVETIEDVKVISNRLGHSSTQMTLDTYSHVLQSRENDMISILGSRTRERKNTQKI